MRLLLPTARDGVTREDLVELYAFPADRIWTRAIFVSSVDGSAQAAGGTSGQLSGPGDRAVFSVQRSLCDAVLVGAGTARAERYRPATGAEVDAAARLRRGLSAVPPIAVVTRSLGVVPELLDPDAAAPTIVLTTQAAAPRTDGLTAETRMIAVGQHDVDLAQALSALAGLGYRRILCEGGPTLVAQLVSAGLLDELCVTFSASLVAGDGMRVLRGRYLDPARPLRLAQLLEEDGALFARYIVDRRRSVPPARRTSARS